MTTKAEVDVDLGNIHAELDLGLDDIQADLGLDDINAQVALNANVAAKAGLDANLATKAALDANVSAKAALDAHADVKADVGAKAELDVRADLGLDDIQAKIGASAEVVAVIRELAPVILKFLWKEIPIVRVAMPHRYKLGFNFLGHELASVTFCGESEIVTEDHRQAKGASHGGP